jgi:hypothetical protein
VLDDNLVIQKIEYLANMPKFYHRCNLVGHNYEICKWNKDAAPINQNSNTRVDMVKENSISRKQSGGRSNLEPDLGEVEGPIQVHSMIILQT